MSEEVTFSKGLAGVIADETKLCLINGEEGKLYYRGYSIFDIAESGASFDEVAYLLLHGSLPTTGELEEFSTALRNARSLSDELVSLIQTLPTSTHPMVALQTATAAMTAWDDVDGEDRAANIRRAVNLIAKMPTVVATFARYAAGKEVVGPRSDLGHAANFLYMVNGEAPGEQAARTFEVALVLHMEHSFNASTFTGRVVASTMSPIYNAVSAAVGALYGPLHGGANERTLRMVHSIGSVDAAEQFVMDKLSRHEKIMGMGHRVYRAKDPRAVILQGMLSDLVKEKGDTTSLDILKKVESVMQREMEKKGKDVWPNVDFFSGALYETLGIETQHFTPIFAIARVVGWTSHIVELWEDNRLYRPRAHYSGDINKSWTPISER